MSQIVQIDYPMFATIAVGLFGLVGFMRGWWKEAITTGLLTMLLLLLKKPDTAAGLINSIDSIVVAAWNALRPILESAAVTTSAVAAEEPPVIDPKRYSIYVIILVLAVIASYFFSKIGLTQTLSAGARLLGGVLGVYNGYVVLTLLREFVIGRYLPGASDMAAAAAPPTTVSIEVTNLPQASLADAPTVYFLIAAGGIVFLVAVATAFRVGRQRPPLYGKEKKAGGQG
jgi:uncharacterized membrane protein required for colicin V production